ncbi:unnamed protein product [Boreogadus saida]
MAGIAENKKRRGLNFTNDELEALVQAVEDRKSSDAKTRGTLKKRDQAKTGAGMPEVKPLTVLEEKILATMGQVYTQGIPTGTEVGLPEEILENVSATSSDSTEVILTLMDAECDSGTLPTAIIIPSPAKKKKHLSLQEELLELEKEKLLVMRETLNVEKERLKLDKEKFEFMKENFIYNGNNIVNLFEQ